MRTAVCASPTNSQLPITKCLAFLQSYALTAQSVRWPTVQNNWDDHPLTRKETFFIYPWLATTGTCDLHFLQILAATNLRTRSLSVNAALEMPVNLHTLSLKFFTIRWSTGQASANLWVPSARLSTVLFTTKISLKNGAFLTWSLKSRKLRRQRRLEITQAKVKLDNQAAVNKASLILSKATLQASRQDLILLKTPTNITQSQRRKSTLKLCVTVLTTTRGPRKTRLRWEKRRTNFLIWIFTKQTSARTKVRTTTKSAARIFTTL